MCEIIDEPRCPHCGGNAIDIDMLTEEQEVSFKYAHTASEYACVKCERVFSQGDAFMI